MIIGSLRNMSHDMVEQIMEDLPDVAASLKGKLVNGEMVAVIMKTVDTGETPIDCNYMVVFDNGAIIDTLSGSHITGIDFL